MANEPEFSKTGVFWDTKAGKIVDSEPEEGVQLVAPGGEVTPDAQVSIDAYKEVANPSEPVVDAEGQDKSKTVTTQATRARK